MRTRPMYWSDGTLHLLDQRLLPQSEVWLPLRTWQDVAAAIRDMAVRGAPAIGVAAGYGMALACVQGVSFEEARAGLAASRPTAVNLFWALERMVAVSPWTPEAALAEAARIEGEDLTCNRAIGTHGAALIEHGARILTICNTGSLATAGHGTALGVIRTAHEQGKGIFVYSCETRPRLQGRKLTAWELLRDNIPFQSIADSAAASLMRAGKVDCVIVGADRIAANGDTANKIGTYSLAVLAAHHGLPFYIAAPSSTLDPSLSDGDQIPIEERDASEITTIDGVQIAPDGCSVLNPAFDVTPGSLITAIITERGVMRSPYDFTAAAGASTA